MVKELNTELQIVLKILKNIPFQWQEQLKIVKITKAYSYSFFASGLK